MLNWLFKSHPEKLDLASLKVDLHSHLIPGIDDGVQTVEEAVDMVRRMESYGYQHLITTPHIMWDCYRNTPEIILSGLRDVQRACQEAGLSTTVDAAAEYYLDAHFNEMLRSGQPLLTLPGKRLLVELPYATALLNTSEILFSIVEHGYRPILAHPERYTYFHRDLSIYQKLSAQGCQLQVNALSLTGHYGVEVAKVADWLLKNNLIVFIGSDAHRMQHLDQMEKMSNSKWLKDYAFQNADLLTPMPTTPEI
jgi:tyrosine-protein phosphatase YwqE